MIKIVSKNLQVLVLLAALFALGANAAGWPFGGSSSPQAAPQENSAGGAFGDDAPDGSVASSSPKVSATPPVYNGTEYRWAFIVIRPALFQTELYILGCFFVYLAIAVLGKTFNRSIAANWMNSQLELLKENFSTVGIVDKNGKPSLVSDDGATRFWSYATGRRNLQYLQVKVDTPPRHDLALTLFDLGRRTFDFTYVNAGDNIQLEFAFDSDYKLDFIWALVDKRYLKTVRDSRWDIETFTSSADSKHIPSAYAVYSEHGTVTETILKDESIGFDTLLNSGHPALKHFVSLVLSDSTLREAPENSVLDSPTPLPNKKTLVLTLKCPSKSRVHETSPLVSFALNIVDALSKVSISSESINRIKKKRKEKLDTLLEDYRREQREQREDEARAKKKKEQEDRFNALSAEEQRKQEKRDRKREMSKSQGKLKRR